MKKIKLPLEMANGVMVRTIDELKENWDLTKVVEHFVSGKLVTWLNDRYYSDIAEKIENLPKDDGKKLQQALCKAFDMLCEDVELDVDEIAERKRRKDLLRQYTSDEKILDNVDYVAFDQEDLAYLLDDELPEIYLFNNKFTIPLNVEDKKYIGIGNVVAEIRSKKPVNFKERNIEFVNVKFDDKYQEIHVVVPEKKKCADKKVGDVINFGQWGGEVIEWLIVSLKDGNAILLSRYIIDSKPYNLVRDNRVTWETCTLRKWLNEEFYEDAFDDDEKKAIVISNVRAHIAPRFPSTYQGGDVTDYIYLLSVEECQRYWCLGIVEKSEPTKFAIQRGVHIEPVNRCAWWWLRTRVKDEVRAAHIFSYDDGHMDINDNGGDCVDGNYNGIRPVLQINLQKYYEKSVEK